MTFHPDNHATGRTGLGLLTPHASVRLMKRQSGFTLVELMVIIALIAILSAIAMPSIQQIQASNRMMTTVNEIVGAFQQARSEAISRSRNVVVEACMLNCGETGTQSWQNGWRIVPESVNCATESCTSFGPLPLNINMTVTGAVLSFTYNPQGRLTDLSATSNIDVCSTQPRGRRIELQPIGRVSAAGDITCE